VIRDGAATWRASPLKLPEAGKPGPFCPGSSLFASDCAYVQVLARVASVPFSGQANLCVTSAFVTFCCPATYITRAMLSNSRLKVSSEPPSSPALLTALRASSAETP